MNQTSRRLLPLSIVALVIGLASVVALGQTKTPGEALPPGPATIESGGVTFKIPRQYITSDYVAKQAEPYVTRKFHVAFWMSDRKSPVEMPLGIFLLDFWPVEKGRPAGGAADFLVNLFVTQRPPGPGGKWVHPSQMAEVTLGNAHWLGEEKRSSVADLECHEFTPRDYPKKTYFKMCHSKPGGMPEIYLVTNWNEKKPANTYWRMDVWFEAEGLWFNVFFPEEALDRWRDVVDACRDLVRSWRVTR